MSILALTFDRVLFVRYQDRILNLPQQLYKLHLSINILWEYHSRRYIKIMVIANTRFMKAILKIQDYRLESRNHWRSICVCIAAPALLTIRWKIKFLPPLPILQFSSSIPRCNRFQFIPRPSELRNLRLFRRGGVKRTALRGNINSCGGVIVSAAEAAQRRRQQKHAGNLSSKGRRKRREGLIPPSPHRD